MNTYRLSVARFEYILFAVMALNFEDICSFVPSRAVDDDDDCAGDDTSTDSVRYDADGLIPRQIESTRFH